MIPEYLRFLLNDMTAETSVVLCCPLVSIIIPCRNEVNFIGSCLDSILSSNYPSKRMEVLIVDGMSDDDTRSVVDAYVRRHQRLKLLDNPKRITAAALNIGIRAATGDVIMRMDAHNIYPTDYISTLVGWLERTGCDNVGGTITTQAASDRPLARAIATALAHPLGVGNSHFRIGVKEPRLVDTVPFGCYRREVFDRIGLFDEELIRNQDDEFNHRLIRRGGRVLLVPEVVSTYYARDSLMALWRMYYQYGYFKPLVAKKLGTFMTVRQVVPATFVLILLLTGTLSVWIPLMASAFAAISVLYVVVVLVASVLVAVQQGASAAVGLPLVFPALHLSYGIGFLRGVFDFFLRGRAGVADPESIPLSR